MSSPRIIAFCYDFDKTLTPENMQDQGFIQDIGMNVCDFWEETSKLVLDKNMDSNLAYMYKMLVKYNQSYGPLTCEKLQHYGLFVKFYDGVFDWFSLLNEYAKRAGIIAEHYICSSGIKEIIEGTSIAGHFKKIYASSYMYDSNGSAIWPALTVNYTNKTQFLFRISKDVLAETDDSVNDYINPGDYRIPFSNMVYIGDSVTDIPCMRLVTNYGGHSIGVYDPKLANTKRVERMLQEGRIYEYCPADYREDSALYKACCKIIDKL